MIPTIGQSPYYWNYCQHKTPQHYVRPEFTEHPNGVHSMVGVMAVHDDPAAAAAACAEPWRLTPTATDPVSVTPGDVTLDIFSPAVFAARYGASAAVGLTGLRLQSRDLSLTASFMVLDPFGVMLLSVAVLLPVYEKQGAA